MTTPSYHKPPTYSVPLWINSTPQLSSSSQPLQKLSPPTQSPLWTYTPSTPSTIQSAIKSSSTSQKSWKSSPISLRTQIFKNLIKELSSPEIQSELSYYIKQEIGAGEDWIKFNINFCIRAIQYTIDNLEDVLKSEVIDGNDGFLGEVFKTPFGVVVGIAPWNAPLILPLRSILSPISSGNTIIFLSSSQSPQTHYFISQLFHKSGLPAGVLNILPIPPDPKSATEIIETLLSSPIIKHLNFTGSTNVGKSIATIAGKYGKPVLLELGGKSVALGLPDLDLDKFSTELIIGSFWNSGQICMSCELAYIPSSLKTTLISLLNQKIPNIFPTSLPIISQQSFQKITNLLKDAISKGATLEYGELPDPSTSNTSLTPIILSNVTPDMEIYKTETFGPVLCLIEYPDDNVEEVISTINDLEYGLSASIFSTNEEKAYQVALEIDSGAVHINHMTVYDNPAFPHGGIKQSGYGRFGGKWGIESFTYLKTITKPSEK